MIKASGVSFAFAKASEGTTYADPYYARNKSEMDRVVITHGAYHYAQPMKNSPIAEAEWFLKCVGQLVVGDLLCLDLEEGVGPLGDWTLQWLQHVENAVGFKPLLYTGAWIISGNSLTDPRLGEYGLWLASWGTEFPPAPAPWPVVAFWQYSSTGRCPGIDGDCDMDLFNGDEAQLALYGKPGGTVESPQQTIDRLRASLRITADGMDDRATELETTAALLHQQAQTARDEASR